MFDTICYIALAIICFIIIALCNGNLDNKCRENGGQIITHSTKWGHSCIYPAGK